MDIIQVISDTRPAGHKSWNDFILYLQEQLDPLQKNGFAYEVRVHHSDAVGAEGLLLRCDRFPQHMSRTEMRETFRHYVSAAVSDFIVEVLEDHLIRDILHRDYKYTQAEEAERIHAYCREMLWMPDREDEVEELLPDHLLADHDLQADRDVQVDHDLPATDDWKVLQRKNQIFKKAYEYLGEEKIFHWDGFIRFRLKDYYAELLETIDFAVEEYVVDQEYQEFIHLLRYFISVQPAKIPLLHIMHMQDQQFHLLDEDGQYIPAEDVEEQLQAWTNETVHPEEFMMSTLITLAPQKIVLHTDDPATSVIRTLGSVFEDRITICRGCQQCRKWKKA